MSRETAPRVSIVVLSHNRPEYTSATLDALTRRSAGTPHEIIVVDNASDRPARMRLQDWRASGRIDKLVLLPKNLGTSGGYNAGFREADPRSEFLSKLDNDIEVLTANWLGPILEIFRDFPKAGIVSADITNHHGVAALPVVDLPGGHRARSWIGWVAGGGGMTIRRSTYQAIGGFNQEFGPDLVLMPDDYDYHFRVMRRLRLQNFYACASQVRMQTHLDRSKYGAYERWKSKQYEMLRKTIIPAIDRGE